MGGNSLVQTHVRSRSLDLNPELEEAVPTRPMIQLIIVAAPVTDVRADATMLRLVPAPVTSTGVDTIMDPNSGDERAAKDHVYQTPLLSAHGKELRYSNVGEGIGPVVDSLYNQHLNVNMMRLLDT